MNCTTASSPSHKEAAVIKRETDRQETRGQEKLRILVSACLLGENCKYSGGSNRDETVLMWKTKLEQEKKAEFIPICPEVAGGLSTPRTPAEIRGERVVTRDGRDVTAEYEAGAKRLSRCQGSSGCRYAVLKERSPSCGSGTVYDGSFSGTLTAGDGIAAAPFKEKRRNGSWRKPGAEAV